MTRDEFSRRITAMTRTLYRVACGVLRVEADREDAVQETILRAWEKRDTLRQEAYFETWVVRILLNQCYTIGRQKRRLVSMEDIRRSDEGAPPETGSVRDAVLALPESLRLPVLLHYVEGYGVEEVGRILALPPGTVKSRLYRARGLLKKELEEAQYE